MNNLSHWSRSSKFFWQILSNFWRFARNIRAWPAIWCYLTNKSTLKIIIISRRCLSSAGRKLSSIAVRPVSLSVRDSTSGHRSFDIWTAANFSLTNMKPPAGYVVRGYHILIRHLARTDIHCQMRNWNQHRLPLFPHTIDARPTKL